MILLVRALDQGESRAMTERISKDGRKECLICGELSAVPQMELLSGKDLVFGTAQKLDFSHFRENFQSALS